MTSENQKFDYQGFHATGDILLKKYPSNMIDLVRDCIKFSNLTVVSEHIEQFTPEASTVVWVLSESHFYMSIFKNVKNKLKNSFIINENELQYA